MGQVVPSAVGAVQHAAADLTAAAESTALQLLLLHLARQNAAKPPRMFSIGVQVNNHPVIKAAMAAMAAGQLTLQRSPMSTAGALMRLAHAEGQGVIQLPHAVTGLQLQLPDSWHSTVQGLVPRLSDAHPASRHARDARLLTAVADAPQLLLEGADGQRHGANGTVASQQAPGWHSGESDTESDYDPEETLADNYAASAVTEGNGTLHITASTSTAVAVSYASAGSNILTTVSSDVRLTSLTGALMPAGEAAVTSVQLPPLSLLTWNIWGAVCAFSCCDCSQRADRALHLTNAHKLVLSVTVQHRCGACQASDACSSAHGS